MKNVLSLSSFESKILHGDVMDCLKRLPDKSIDCVITSPPYWQLRNYGFKSQWGLEKTFMEYLNRLWKMMKEIHRVLKDKGTVWVNLGDTFFGSGNGSGRSRNDFAQPLHKVKIGQIVPVKPNTDKANLLPLKCLSLIPHRFAIGCIEQGWILRNDIIWAKPNSLPESVKDRFSKKHEHIFFFVKQHDYYFDLDAVRDPHLTESLKRSEYKMTSYQSRSNNTKAPYGKGKDILHKKIKLNVGGKNPGDVADFWKISNKSSRQKHYATFNTGLIEKPILSGCPKGGIVLDPFCGTGTTGVCAIELGRKFIGIDAKKEYCKIAENNILKAIPRQENIKSITEKLLLLNF